MSGVFGHFQVGVDTTIDWSKRDMFFAEQVDSICEVIKNADGKPKRVTKSNIYSALGYKTMLDSNKDKLPLTSKAINDAIETLDQFRLRRCYWIIDELQKQNTHLTVPKVLNLTSLNKPQTKWKAIIEEIFKEKGL